MLMANGWWLCPSARSRMMCPWKHLHTSRALPSTSGVKKSTSIVIFKSLEHHSRPYQTLGPHKTRNRGSAPPEACLARQASVFGTWVSIGVASLACEAPPRRTSLSGMAKGI